jgi:hypothetical protein
VSNSPHRSYEPISDADLARLAELAAADLSELFGRSAYARPYRNRLSLLCLCQGAAQHFVHGDRGIHDFDVWAFYRAIPNHPFPHRRRGRRDFGPSRFGRNPDAGGQYTGRRVDVIGRSIDQQPRETPIQAVQRYLRNGHTESARLLAERPVIVLWPECKRGQVIWEPGRPSANFTKTGVLQQWKSSEGGAQRRITFRRALASQLPKL